MTRRGNSAAEHLAREYGNMLDVSNDERSRHQGPRQRRGQRPKNQYKAGFSHEKALIYGVVQCLAGVAFVVLGVVSVATSAWGYEYGCGLWSGMLCLTAGVLGLASSRSKTNKTITTFMISSAMAATAALITLAISSVGIVADHSLFDEIDMSSYSSALVVHSLTIVVSIVAAFCGTMAAIVGCRGVCGGWYGADDLPHDDDIYTQPPNNFLPGVYNDEPDHGSMADYPSVPPGLGMSGVRNSPMLGSGYQQIAIVPPVGHGNSANIETDDPSGRMIIMQSSGHGNQGLSQVMYILQAGAPCPQPGQRVPESTENTHSSPPPSYSTLALDVLSHSGDSHYLDPDRTSGSTSENRSEAPHDLSSYSYDISCPSNITNMILQDLCRRTNNSQQQVYIASSSHHNANSSSNHSANVQLNDSRDIDPHGDDYYALREGETSFSSEWSNSQQPSAASPNPPDSITDQDLPLLEASPQRYRPRQQNNNHNQNGDSLVTYI